MFDCCFKQHQEQGTSATSMLVMMCLPCCFNAGHAKTSMSGCWALQNDIKTLRPNSRGYMYMNLTYNM